MTGLRTKLVRDLRTMRWQAASIALVVACGVAVLVASYGTYRSLLDARDAFYARARFASVFAQLTRAPDSVADELARLDGVAAIETRLAFDVPLDLPGVSAPVAARAISLPRPGAGSRTRRIVRAGRMPRDDARDEVAVTEAFAQARRLRPGDRIPAVLNGRHEELTLVGTVLSAEHSAAMRPGELIPDDAHYGVLFVPYEALASAYRAEGTFDEVLVWLAPRASEARVIAGIDRVLEPYGGYGAYGRSEHPAHRFVDDELAELEVEATVLPVVFLGVAIFLLHMVLARIVAQERTQIATLRALGFRVAPIVLHYVALATSVAGAGGLGGVGLGGALGVAMTRLYARFFRFPRLEFALEPRVLAVALVVSLTAGALGALSSARRLARLAPAEALQPAAPPAFRESALERVLLARRGSAPARLAVRSVTSHPLRSAASTAGIAAAMGILVAGSFWRDAFDALLAHQFGRVRREDATVTFAQPLRERAVRELEHLPGVRFAEGFRGAPAWLSHGGARKRVALLGLPARSRLRRLVSADGAEVQIPPHGVVLSGHLAKRLGAGRGARLGLEFLEGERPRTTVVVSAVVEERIGMSAYLDRDALAHLLDEGPAVSGALLALERGHEREVHAAIRRFPAIELFSIEGELIRRFRQTMMRIVVAFSAILTALGAAVVVGIVYNAARVLASEHERELATMRVLGFSRGQVADVLFVELALQVLPALPLGALTGYGLAALAVRTFGPEELSIPLVIAPRTWALATSVVLASAAASGLAVRRRIARTDLVAGLKARE